MIKVPIARPPGHVIWLSETAIPKRFLSAEPYGHRQAWRSKYDGRVVWQTTWQIVLGNGEEPKTQAKQRKGTEEANAHSRLLTEVNVQVFKTMGPICYDYRAVSIIGVDTEYGDTVLLRNLATHVQDYTESEPRKPQCKNNFKDTTPAVCAVRR